MSLYLQLFHKSVLLSWTGNMKAVKFVCICTEFYKTLLNKFSTILFITEGLAYLKFYLKQ